MGQTLYDTNNTIDQTVHFEKLLVDASTGATIDPDTYAADIWDGDSWEAATNSPTAEDSDTACSLLLASTEINGKSEVKIKVTAAGAVGTAYVETFAVEKVSPIYVAASGGDDGNPGTKEAPLATITQAHTNAVAGETIHCLDGTHTITPITLTKKDLTIEGQSREGTLITGSLSFGQALFTLTDGTTFRRLRMVEDGAGATFISNGADNLTFDNVYMEGTTNVGIINVTLSSNSVLFKNCETLGHLDGVLVVGVLGFRAVDSIFRKDNSAETSQGTQSALALAGVAPAQWYCTAVMDNCHVSAAFSDAPGESYVFTGLNVSNGATVTGRGNTILSSTEGQTGWTGTTAALLAKSSSSNPRASVHLTGGRIDSAIVVDNGTPMDIYNPGTGATPKVTLIGVPYDTAKVSANVTLQPLAEDIATVRADTQNIAQDTGTDIPLTLVELAEDVAAVGADVAANATVLTSLGADAIPVSQASVPLGRTWLAKNTDSDGLVGETTHSVIAGGVGKLWAIDFRNDLPTNGRLSDINSVAIQSGTEGGVTFGADIAEIEDYGVDRSKAKFRLTPVTAGTYAIRVSVDYSGSDGGGSSECDVTLVVI